ncbi:hypothetical protein SAMN05216276_102954 [Streptosporangium subroseum]|uniref:SnoaL-like domain-containing protein n=1 Tax=Streptosporangium subroseum TaxID=106412 RepID=A0A239KYC2_9ACTN|nr:nuclear transport factor 2 family protein [Streptosporangium subroseum]SNT22603.1 hypothetical protein SAMN05216276_102954 [Streptosporangium subroseum]
MSHVVDRLVSALDARDLAATMRCYSPQAVVVGPELQAEGLEEIAACHMHLFEGFPALRMTVWEKVVCGDLVMIEALASGTHGGPFLLAGGEVLQATGRAVNIRTCWVFTLADDLIVSQRVYYDQLEVYSQIGLRLPSTSESFD